MENLGAQSFMKKLFDHILMYVLMTLHSCISSRQMKPFLKDFVLDFDPSYLQGKFHQYFFISVSRTGYKGKLR
jgi:hypothetical protein